jgi:putative acetyltransferase
MKIRRAAPADWAGIRNAHLHAFQSQLEADLVEKLEADGDACVSIVAEDCGMIVGHVLLSRMTVDADGESLRAMGLGPVAVIPARQNQGIGIALVEAAVEAARESGEHMLFVLGEPAYYGRFGFRIDRARPFASPYAGPHFQALALVELPPVKSGSASYADAFAGLS